MFYSSPQCLFPESFLLGKLPDFVGEDSRSTRTVYMLVITLMSKLCSLNQPEKGTLNRNPHQTILFISLSRQGTKYLGPHRPQTIPHTYIYIYIYMTFLNTSTRKGVVVDPAVFTSLVVWRIFGGVFPHFTARTRKSKAKSKSNPKESTPPVQAYLPRRALRWWSGSWRTGRAPRW